MDVFVRQAAQWGVTLTGGHIDLLKQFGTLLEGYSDANVIGTRSYARIMEDHVLDSLSCLLVRGFDEARSMVDVGAGAGFPGIPLKIARPSIRTSLLESTAKKTAFARLVVADLGLEDLTILNARAEDIGRDPDHRAHYDMATVRAVSSVAVVAEYCVPLVRNGGHVVAMKGRLTDMELEEGRRAASLLGARVAEVVRVPLLDEVRIEERRLVVLEKVRETPRRYPRRPGTARRRPLGSGSKRK